MVVAPMLAVLLWQIAASGGQDPLAILANSRRIESRHVGPAGEHSATYAAFDALSERSDRTEVLPLLKHPSPIVRAYMAWHVTRAFPTDIPRLAPLLSDDAPIDTIVGCISDHETVAG